MFDCYVLPMLKELNFFAEKKSLSWLTMGLIEGEIAALIDETVSPYGIETGYRWHYPYLEIKLSGSFEKDWECIIAKIEAILARHVVSRDKKEAFETLDLTLQTLKHPVRVYDQVTFGEFICKRTYQNLSLIDDAISNSSEGLFFHASCSESLQNQSNHTGSLTLISRGYFNDELRYEHQLITSNRGPEVAHFAQAYVAWQLKEFLGMC